jgi:hypothetical protein
MVVVDLFCFRFVPSVSFFFYSGLYSWLARTSSDSFKHIGMPIFVKGFAFIRLDFPNVLIIFTFIIFGVAISKLADIYKQPHVRKKMLHTMVPLINDSRDRDV